MRFGKILVRSLPYLPESFTFRTLRRCGKERTARLKLQYSMQYIQLYVGYLEQDHRHIHEALLLLPLMQIVLFSNH